jgi:hypothetical protein
MISRSDFDRTIELNLKSVFLCTPLNHRDERRNGVQLKALTLFLETSVPSEAEADGQGAPRLTAHQQPRQMFFSLAAVRASSSMSGSL